MKLIRSILTCLFLLAALNVAAQSEKVICGTNEFYEYLKSIDPDYEQRRAEFERMPKSANSVLKSGSENYIPVVVHVIYREEAQNISEAQIKSQIDVLNWDLNAKNWDTLNIPQPFKSLIGKADLKFVLADRDENGNKTNGITRTKTTIKDLVYSSSDIHCNTSKGGIDPWDRDRYLNIWVCEIAGGLYGFASYPGAPSGCDGLVISFESFGTMGTAIPPTHKGRTATHEFGHWLNLIHIWGDALCGDDLISDTPDQDSANYDCRNFPHVSCNNAPNGDLFMNYMDYSDDDCMHLFTKGQVTRMEDAIAAFRPNLINSSGYNEINDFEVPLSSVGPNPASRIFSIHAPFILKSVQLLTLGGKTISIDHSPLKFDFSLDVSSIPNGLYILQIVSDKERTEYHKIIVQH